MTTQVEIVPTWNGSARAIHAPSPEIAASAKADAAPYDALYAASVADPETFLAKEAQRLDRMRPFSTIKNTSFDHDNVSIKWFEDGTINVAANRHVATHGDQTAIIWESDSLDEAAQHITYGDLHREVSTFANALEELGVGKGDRVVIYLPVIPADRRIRRRRT